MLWKRRPIAGALGKLTCLWDDGVYLGIKSTTGELIIGTVKGILEDRDAAEKTGGAEVGQEGRADGGRGALADERRRPEN